MIPSDVATAWLEYLSTFHRTVPFCAAHEKVSVAAVVQTQG